MSDDEEYSYGDDTDLFGTDENVPDSLASAPRVTNDMALFKLHQAAVEEETDEEFHKVTYSGSVSITPEQLEQCNMGNALTFKTTDGSFDLESVEYSNKEDMTEKAHALGACDIVKAIDIKFDTDVQNLKWVAEVPSVNATVNERSRQLETRSDKSPNGAVVGEVTANGAQPDRILSRKIAKGMMAWGRSYGGHTADTIKKTVFYTHNGKGAYIEMQPASPVAEYYNAHPDVQGQKIAPISVHQADENGMVSANLAVTRYALDKALTAFRDHIAFANVTDPKQFSVIVRPKEDKTFDPLTKMHVKTTVSLASAHIRNLDARLQQQAATNTKKAQKIASLKDQSMKVPIRAHLTATVYYRKVPPTFNVAAVEAETK